MDLAELGLTASQKAFRRNVIGGSDANIIMNGSPGDIYRLWQQKRGLVEPENLDDVLPVIMGQWTEPLNRAWFERRTGRAVTDAGAERLCLDYPWMAATLDGMTDLGETIFEAKHVNAFAKEAETFDKYQPQCHHNMIVCGVDRAVLSVFYGTLKYEFYDIQRDAAYATALVAAESAFWRCVETGVEPVDLPRAQTPTEKAAARSVVIDLTGSEDFRESAQRWLSNERAAKDFEKATKDIKALLDADVIEATGHGIVARFNRNNALTIKKAA